jgi:glycosyltransferase involved in cell wall biosynthesis
MKILLLPDNLNNWAIHNKALALKKFLPEYEYDIQPAFGNKDCLVNEREFDIVHFLITAGLTPMFYDYIMSHKNKVAITIVNERSLLYGHLGNPEQLDKIFKECPYINSLTPMIAEKYRIPYVKNGIDKDKFFKYKKPVIGFAGAKYIGTKNVELLETVCKHLDLELKLTGYLSLLNTGETEHEKMQDFYLDLDVYIHPSTTEGFNNTIIEALSCNIPVLMTRAGGWKEFEGWVEFIEPTVEDIEFKLQKYLGRRLIEQKFLWEQIMPEYKRMYEAIRNASPYRTD